MGMFGFWAFAAFVVVGLITFIIHWRKPVTWQDGEGSVLDDAIISSGAFRKDPSDEDSEKETSNGGGATDGGGKKAR